MGEEGRGRGPNESCHPLPMSSLIRPFSASSDSQAVTLHCTHGFCSIKDENNAVHKRLENENKYFTYYFRSKKKKIQSCLECKSQFLNIPQLL